VRYQQSVQLPVKLAYGNGIHPNSGKLCVKTTSYIDSIKPVVSKESGVVENVGICYQENGLISAYI
jgi:hypothetical protein